MNWWTRPLIAALLTASSLVPSAQRTDIDGYETLEIEGFTVRVEKTLGGDDKIGVAAIELLRTKLFDVRRTVPEKALAELRHVAIFLDRNDDVAPCAVYHPSAEWLAEHKKDVRKARCVHIANAERFLEWSLQQPSMVLHELAHAYHHQVLGYEEPRIRAAYERVKASKAYESVLHWSGEKQRHYALENEQEFFAETTEAWFGTNDFHPFVRAEILAEDPETARLMTELWSR